MKQTQATRRLGEQLREKLGYILLFEVSDPRLDLVTLTAVEVAVDRSFARVYVSCDASRYDEVMEALASAKGRIRSPVSYTHLDVYKRQSMTCLLCRSSWTMTIALPSRPAARPSTPSMPRPSTGICLLYTSRCV